jgi:hypothetical protein
VSEGGPVPGIGGPRSEGTRRAILRAALAMFAARGSDTASSGEKGSASTAARLMWAGVSRFRRSSTAARGMVSPIATSFAVNL